MRTSTIEIAQPATRGTLVNKLRAIAVPNTYVNFSQQCRSCGIRLLNTTHLSDISRNDSSFGEEPEGIVEPRRTMLFDVLGEIQASNGAELDTQRLEEDSNYIRHQYHDKQSKSERRSCCYICSVVAFETSAKQHGGYSDMGVPGSI